MRHAGLPAARDGGGPVVQRVGGPVVPGHPVLRVPRGQAAVRVGEHAADVREDQGVEDLLPQPHVHPVQGPHLAAVAQERTGPDHAPRCDAAPVDPRELCQRAKGCGSTTIAVGGDFCNCHCCVNCFCLKYYFFIELEVGIE